MSSFKSTYHGPNRIRRVEYLFIMLPKSMSCLHQNAILDYLFVSESYFNASLGMGLSNPICCICMGCSSYMQHPFYIYVVANVESVLELSQSTLASNLGLMFGQLKKS